MSAVKIKTPGIIVFGGTSEGKKAAAVLDSEKLLYFYSTKTRTDFQPSDFCEYIRGELDDKTLPEFVRKRKIKLIINAAHPFACRLHATVAGISKKGKIPVIRYERKYPGRKKHPLVAYCGDYGEAARELKDEKGACLIASGVQTLAQLKPLWKNKKRCYARILPRKTSVATAVKCGFPKNRLILEMPSSDPEKEKRLFEKLKIKSVVTKESGISGGQEAKINAAIQSGIKTAVIKRPGNPVFDLTVFSETEMIEKIRGFANVP